MKRSILHGTTTQAVGHCARNPQFRASSLAHPASPVSIITGFAALTETKRSGFTQSQTMICHSTHPHTTLRSSLVKCHGQRHTFNPFLQHLLNGLAAPAAHVVNLRSVPPRELIPLRVHKLHRHPTTRVYPGERIYDRSKSNKPRVPSAPQPRLCHPTARAQFEKFTPPSLPA